MGRNRIIYCGGRDFEEIGIIYRIMKETFNEYGSHIVVTGGARGADKSAEYCAQKLGYTVESYPADWGTHGKAAGFIRNAQMAKLDNVILTVAFPGGNGTAHMIETSKKNGIPVNKIVEGRLHS